MHIEILRQNLFIFALGFQREYVYICGEIQRELPFLFMVRFQERISFYLHLDSKEESIFIHGGILRENLLYPSMGSKRESAIICAGEFTLVLAGISRENPIQYVLEISC